MTLLRKQPGLPFLLSLGILFILSASFLAVQLWSGDSAKRGSAHALEAPVMPKSLELSKKSPKPVAVAANPVADQAVAEPKEIAVASESDSTVEDLSEPVEEVKPKKASEQKKKSEVAPVKAKEAAVPAPVKSEVAVPADSAKAAVEKVEAKAEIKTDKPAKKSRKSKKVKSKKVVEEEENSSVIPPEWDWFSTPLKIDMSQGKVEIVAASNARDVSLANAAGNLSQPSFEPVVVAPVVTESVAEPSSVPVVEKTESTAAAPAVVAVASTEKPFALALARMAKIRQIREARNAEKAAVAVTPAPEKSSPTMRRMGEVVKVLMEKLDKRPVKTTGSEEVIVPAVAASDAGASVEVAPVKSSGGTEELESADETPQFKAYYSGSGSSFSNRVNEMIKRGDWLKD